MSINIQERSLSEIALTARTEFKFFVRPWLYDGSVNMLFAPTGHGKSHWAFHMALAIAEGGTWIGKACTRGKVLYIDGEMGESQWLKRFPNNKFLTDTADTLKILCPEHFPNGFMYSLADKTRHGFWLEKCAPYDVIFIDNFFTTCTPIKGNESDVELWQSAQTLINRLKQQRKAVVLIHHTNKSGMDQSGTGQRDVLMDTTMRLRQWPKQTLVNGITWEIKVNKDRNNFFEGKLETLIDVQFTDDGIRAFEKDIKRERMFLAKNLLIQGCTKTNIAEELGISVNQVSQLLYEIDNSGKKEETGEASEDDDLLI